MRFKQLYIYIFKLYGINGYFIFFNSSSIVTVFFKKNQDFKYPLRDYVILNT
ncbi:hypothetical protein HanHA300_Chr08g0296551 [Helianthus annuus]|nr:hypothetical protein HanHA300_Chr08g0296551 [Helianthus annuus]KAJ0548789.1 hypothetical protein HanIR_Chr08g0387741 [Helianthus annuus]KAJ0903233.1 hypothetical protein HanPSC8_Chr08g0346681 [Helianthus annuus]